MDDPLEWQPRGKIMMIFLEQWQVALGVGPPKVPSWKLGMGHDGSKLSIFCPKVDLQNWITWKSHENHMKITWTFHQIFSFPHGPLADLSLMLVHWNPKDNVFVHVKVAVQQSVMPESTELVPWLWRSLKSGGYMDIWIFGYLHIMNQSIRTFVFSNCGDLYFRRNKVYAFWKLYKTSMSVNRGSHFQVRFVWQVWDGQLSPSFKYIRF